MRTVSKQKNGTGKAKLNEWPICQHPSGCLEPVNPKRVEIIGKVRCLQHGDPPKTYTTAPAYNKGAIQLITHGDIEDIGK